MVLDKIIIGTRIRKIREELFKESREKFGKRCNLTERHIGQIERGDFLISLHSLCKITSSTGVDTDYILYGKGQNDALEIKKNLINIIDKCNKEELDVIYKCITTIRDYITNKNI